MNFFLRGNESVGSPKRDDAEHLLQSVTTFYSSDFPYIKMFGGLIALISILVGIFFAINGSFFGGPVIIAAVVFLIMFLTREDTFKYNRQVADIRIRGKSYMLKINEIRSIEIIQRSPWHFMASISNSEGMTIAIPLPMPGLTQKGQTLFDFVNGLKSKRVLISMRVLRSTVPFYFVGLFALSLLIAIVQLPQHINLLLAFGLTVIVGSLYFLINFYSKPLQSKEESDIEPVIFMKKPSIGHMIYGVVSMIFSLGIVTGLIWQVIVSRNFTMLFFCISLQHSWKLGGDFFAARESVTVTEGQIIIKSGRKSFTAYLDDIEVGEPYKTLFGQKLRISTRDRSILIFNHICGGESVYDILHAVKMGKKVVPLYNPDFPGIRLEYNDALE